MSLWKKWLGKAEPPGPGPDPRIEFLLSDQSVCACCGTQSARLLSLAAEAPDLVGRRVTKQENSALLSTEGDVLTEDFCRFESYRFVRCTIEFPIQGSDQVFVYGCWGSLSPENFDHYIAHFDDRDTHMLAPVFSWLANAIPADADTPIACQMRFRDNAQRPQLFVQDQEHPLFDIQQAGLDADTLLAWLKSFGHAPLAPNKLN